LPVSYSRLCSKLQNRPFCFYRKPLSEFRVSWNREVSVIQEIVPVLWAYGIFNFLSKLKSVVTLPSGVEQSPIAVLGMTALIAAFSFGAFHLFSSYKRLERNLPPGVLPAEGGAIPRRSLLQSTALLVVFGVSFPAGEWFLGFRFPAFGFPTLVMAVALAFDLVAEWRFRQKASVACVRRTEALNPLLDLAASPARSSAFFGHRKSKKLRS
jgi:hypothetical protein